MVFADSKYVHFSGNNGSSRSFLILKGFTNVVFVDKFEVASMIDWISEFGTKLWSYDIKVKGIDFMFQSEEDATLFKLTWSQT